MLRRIYFGVGMIRSSCLRPTSRTCRQWSSMTTWFIAQSVLALCVSGSSCPVGWTEYGGNCYKVHDTRLDWADSRQLCLDDGAELTTLASPAEMDFVNSLADSAGLGADYWIGLYGCRSSTFAIYFWLDNTPVSSSWSHWHPSEPNNHGEQVRAVRGTQEWRDVTSPQNYAAICKITNEGRRTTFKQQPVIPATSSQRVTSTPARSALDCARSCASHQTCRTFSYNATSANCYQGDDVCLNLKFTIPGQVFFF